MHKVGLLGLLRMFEKIEQSGYPVAITRLNLKPRAGEPDSYEVELGVSAYDRKPDVKDAKTSPASSATPDEQEAP
jgi:general secretion pathway protein M